MGMLFWMMALLAETAPLMEHPSDDEFSPMLFGMLLIAVAVCLILLGIGIVLALVGVACAAALVALGIVSSSTVIALWRGRAAAGLRALHYQICAAVAVPGGVTLLWAVSTLFGLQTSWRSIVLFGVPAGLAAGLLGAGIADWAARVAYRRLLLAGEPVAATVPAASTRG